MLKEIKQESGFTIIEVLISALILGIGIVAVASLQVTAIKGNISGGDRTIATSILNAKLSELRSRSYYMEGETGNFFCDKALENMDELMAFVPVNAQGLTVEEFKAMCGCEPSSSIIREVFPYQIQWQVRDTGIQSAAGASKTIDITVQWAIDEVGVDVEQISISGYPLSIKYR